MEESQQEHLLSATILNLRLTKETIAEKDRQLATKDCQLAEKDWLLVEKIHQLADQLAKKDCQLSEKDQLLAEKDRQFADRLAQKDCLLTEKDSLLTKKDRQLAEKDRQLDEQLAHKDRQLLKVIAKKDSQMLETLVRLQQGMLDFTGSIHGSTCYRFTLERFSECQKNGPLGDWYSKPFDLNGANYQLQLNVETNVLGRHMDILLCIKNGDVTGKVLIFALQMLNQQSDRNHILQQFEATVRAEKDFLVTSDRYHFIPFKDLYKKDANIQYLKNDCLEFVLWIKEKK